MKGKIFYTIDLSKMIIVVFSKLNLSFSLIIFVLVIFFAAFYSDFLPHIDYAYHGLP